MDSSIMKFLEEDEDETMHSGADVDAFTAALNRDIEGDNNNNNNNNTSTSQPQPQTPVSSDTATALSQVTNETPSQLFQKWQSSTREEDVKHHIQEKQSSAMEPNRHISGSETQHHPNDTSRDISQQSRPQEDQHNAHMSQALSSRPEDIGQPNRPQDDQHNVHMSQAMSNRPQDIGQPNRPQVDQHNVHMSHAMNSRPQDISQPSRPQGDQHNVHMPQAMNSRPQDISQPSRPQGDQHNAHMSQAMNIQNTTDKNPTQTITRNPENESQLQRMQRMSNQQAMPTGQAANAMKPSGKQVPFAMLLPVIEPQLDKDRAMQLQGLYNRLKSNNINKEEFVRHMRTLVGDHMLKMAVYKLQQGQVPKVENAPNRFPHPNQLPAKQNIQKPSPYVATSSIHQSSDSSSLPMDNAQKSRLMEHHSDTAIKQQQQQQQHMHFPQSSFPTFGTPGGNYPPGSNPNMNISSQLQMRQGPVHPSMGSQPMNPMSMTERQNVLNEMKRMNPGGLAHFANNSSSSGHWQPSMGYGKPDSMDQMNNQQHKSQGIEQVSGSSKDDTFEMSSRPGFSTPMNKPEPMSITAQLERQNASAVNSSLGPGSNVKTPPKKPTIGQKKPLEAPASSLSKKQKVSGAFSDQSIEQLNDVTAVSGVNLKEEEEHLFSGSKEDSRASEASRKVVQEEEERLILQKNPLQKKMAEIMTKCGVKNRSGDVDRCLSLCVEERMRGLISNLIRLSKQRVDIEKSRHRTVITSDVRQQIMSMNQKAREEWEKKHADAEKLQRADESEGDGEDGRGKSSKVNKEEDDKMRTTAANVAARAAVGGDDMLSKWQLMAEQARQKRDGGPDASSSSTTQPSVNIEPKPVSTSDKNTKENSDVERTSVAATATLGPVRKTLRNQDLPRSSSIPRTISVKDVIAVLGREVQMSRSTLIYRLYEKVRSDSVSE